MHCILWISHVPPFLSTLIASAGHLLEQIPHSMHFSSSMSILPLVLSCHSLSTTGYMRVAGFLNTLCNTVFAILKAPITLTYLSVQLMQGSIVSTIIGTSARSQPCNILTNAGMFMLVGVLTRILCRNLESAPFA